MALLLPKIQALNYYLTNHPSIVSFRWSPTESWGSTWSFLVSSITLYLFSSIVLHLIVSLFPRHIRLSLGPLPALHSLFMTLLSLTNFVGIFLSTAAEIHDTRWLWRYTHTSTAFHWLLCFPLGTRPTGRVFFWSYIFYLSRFVHLLRTYFTIIRHRKLSFYTLFNQSTFLLMSFLWLEFSQSFQVMAIVLSTLCYSVVYGHRFWTAIGLPRACFPFVVNFQVVLLGCNLVCHLGVFLLHFLKGGCNGIGAWGFNSVLNGFVLLSFLRFYVNYYNVKRQYGQSRRGVVDSDDGGGEGSSSKRLMVRPDKES